MRIKRGGTVIQTFNEEGPERGTGQVARQWIDSASVSGSTTYGVEGVEEHRLVRPGCLQQRIVFAGPAGAQDLAGDGVVDGEGGGGHFESSCR
jgi:hypothetical protein